MDKLIPINSGVLCDPIEADKPEGIIIPDGMQKESSSGYVVRVAKGITEVSVGDKVIWKELSGTLIDDLVLIDISDILLRF
jgi:co-chaperonin GroES (HSP10)